MKLAPRRLPRFLLLAAGTASAQEAPAPVTIADLALTVTPPALEQLTAAAGPAGSKAAWRGALGPSKVDIRVVAVNAPAAGFAEPEDVAETVRDDLWTAFEKSDESPAQRLSFQPLEVAAGKYGVAAHGALLTGERVKSKGGEPQSVLLIATGLAERGGWAVVVEAAPPPTAEGRAVLSAFLKSGLASSAKPRDPRWTDAEAEARWNAMAPPSSQMKLGKLVRTAHFIVLSNASSADRYGKTLEERYAEVKKGLGFTEVATHRLLPVFLFRTGDEMRTIVLKHLGISDSDANVDSFARDDFLVTSADSDDEMEETADLVDQLWRNRLRANGGGGWLRRGTMELLGYPDSNRTITASQLKKGRYTPLAKLLDDESWASRTNTEMPYSEQCAFFVEFLRESKATKDVFPAIVRAVGALPSDTPAWTAEVLSGFLKADLPAIEKNWIQHCGKRKK